MHASDAFDQELKFILADKLALKFRTPQEIFDWLEREVSFYDNVLAPARQDPAIQRVWNQVRGWFANFRTTIQNLINNPKSNVENFKEALDSILQRYSSANLISSESTWGRYVQQTASTDPILAGCLLIALGTVGFSLQDSGLTHIWLRAGVLGESLRRGWLDSKPAADEGLQIFRQEWEGRLQGLESGHQKRLLELDSLIKSLEEQKTNWQERLGAFEESNSAAIKKQDSEIRQAIEAASTEMENFKITYNEALSLRAPTQYWRIKRTGHQRAAFGWLIVFGVAAAAGVAGVWFVWHETVQLSHSEPTYSAFIPSIGAGLLAAWILRIFSRQALTNFSLGADAGERVAMVNTYLALLQGGHANESDRPLILSALFRTASKVSDDAAPPTVADVITKAIKWER